MKKIIAELENRIDDLLDLRGSVKKVLVQLEKISAEANARLEELKQQADAPGEIALPTDHQRGVNT